jgi:hypothetical protein
MSTPRGSDGFHPADQISIEQIEAGPERRPNRPAQRPCGREDVQVPRGFADRPD